MARLSYSLLFTCLAVSANAQIKGRVEDATTGKPLPFATISVDKAAVGTVANKDGYYQLKIPAPYRGQHLLVRYMGYNTDTIKSFSTGKEYISRLHPSSAAMREVVIMPEDTLILLIRKAEKAIPRNYPAKPISYEGFYKSDIQTLDGKYLSIGEAIIKGYKNSYKHESHDSNISIEESRKWVLNQKDSLLKFSFYGGPHFAYTQDYILERHKIVQGDKRYYHYQLSDIVDTPFGEAYKIEFDTREDTLKGSYKGYMLINKKSLAFQLFRFALTPGGLKEWDRKDLFRFKHSNHESTICYEPVNGVWNLKYLTHNFKLSSRLLWCTSIAANSTFIVTRIDTIGASPISLNRQLGYMEPYILRMTPYNKTSWTDYTLIEQDTDIARQIMARPYTGITRETKGDRLNAFKNQLLRINSRLYFTIDLYQNTVNSSSRSYDITLLSSEGKAYGWRNVSAPRSLIYFGSKFGYSIIPSLSVFYSYYDPIVKESVSKSRELGLSFRSKHNIFRRKVFTNIDLSYYSGISGFRVGGFDGGGSFTVDERSYTANRTSLYMGVKGKGFNLQVSGSVALYSWVQLRLFGGYRLPLEQKTTLFFRKKQSWYLGDSYTPFETGSSYTTFTASGEKTAPTLRISNFYFGTGLYLGLNIY